MGLMKTSTYRCILVRFRASSACHAQRDIPWLSKALSRRRVALKPADGHATGAEPADYCVAQPRQHIVTRRPLTQPREHDRAPELGIVLLGQAQVPQVIGLGCNSPMPREWLPIFKKLGDTNEHGITALHKNTVLQPARAQQEPVFTTYHPDHGRPYRHHDCRQGRRYPYPPASHGMARGIVPVGSQRRTHPCGGPRSSRAVGPSAHQ